MATQAVVSTLIKLQHSTNKYSKPDIVSLFKEWKLDLEYDDNDVFDDMANCPMTDSIFIADMLEKKAIANEQDAQMVFDAISTALSENVMSSDPVESQPRFGNPKSNPIARMSSSETEQPQLLSAVSEPITRLERSIQIISDNEDEDDVKEPKSSQTLHSIKQPTKRSQRHSSLPVELLSVTIPDDIYNENMKNKSSFRKRVSGQAKELLAGDAKGARDILRIEMIGQQNRQYPVLNHFVDSYNRCRVNEWIKSDYNMINIHTTQFFTEYCKHPEFTKYHQKNKGVNFISSAINCYNGRLLPQFSCMEQPFKIVHNDAQSAVMFAEYLFNTAQGIRAKLHPHGTDDNDMQGQIIIPMQLDLLIINQHFKTDDDSSDDNGFSDDDSDSDDDSENENEEKTDLGDIGLLLKGQNIQYEYLYRPRDLKSLNQLNEIVGGQQCQRVVLVVDRRSDIERVDDDVTSPSATNVDPIYMFQPPEPYGDFAQINELCTPALHINCLKSMLPKGKKGFHGVKDKLNGQMCVFSFQVMSADEIRCYMFYGGECLRFCKNDIFNVLPELFDKPEEVREMLKAKLEHEDPTWRNQFDAFGDTLRDVKFDQFYQGLTEETPDIEIQCIE